MHKAPEKGPVAKGPDRARDRDKVKDSQAKGARGRGNPVDLPEEGRVVPEEDRLEVDPAEAQAVARPD